VVTIQCKAGRYSSSPAWLRVVTGRASQYGRYVNFRKLGPRWTALEYPDSQYSLQCARVRTLHNRRLRRFFILHQFELAAFELEEAEVQDATTQIGLEIALDEAGQAAMLLAALGEGRPVLGDGLVKDRLFRAAAGVAVRALRSVGVRLSGRWSGHAPTDSARAVPKPVALSYRAWMGSGCGRDLASASQRQGRIHDACVRSSSVTSRDASLAEQFEPMLYGARRVLEALGIEKNRTHEERFWASDVLVGHLMGYLSGYLLPTLLYYEEFRTAPHDHAPERPRVLALPIVTDHCLQLSLFGQF
jgi:hypothetical protein